MDRPYEHESLEKLQAVLADERIGEPAKRRIREELRLRRGDGPTEAKDEGPATSPARTMRFCLPMPPNTNQEERAEHWSSSYKRKKAYWAACDALVAYGALPKPPARPFERVRIEAKLYVWNPMDKVNAMHRLKVPEDWLVKNGYVVDDSEAHVEWAGLPEQEVDRECQRIVIWLRPPRST